MTPGTWKRREREAAALFGTLRNVGSGSLNRAERSTSDSIHDQLYLEVKCRPDHPARKLLEEAKREAADLNPYAVPIVRIFRPGDHDYVLCLHSSDVARFPGSLWHGTFVSRSRAGVLTLMDETNRKAWVEEKIPVLMLASAGRKGFVVVVRRNDVEKFKAIVAEQLRKDTDEQG